MKILITSILMALSMCSFAQTVGVVSMKNLNSEYVEIAAHYKILASKYQITIDFGQNDKNFNNSIKDEKGKPMEFSSIVEALNFMDKNGYYLIQVYVVNEGGASTSLVNHYLLRRKKTENN